MSHTDVSSIIDKLVRPEIKAMKAYHVPESTGLLKLDAMENPYQWPEAMQQEWLELLKSVELNRYPDPAAKQLCEQLAAVSYTHLTLPRRLRCRSRWSPYH